METMEKVTFEELLEKSVIFQGILVLGLTATACYLWVTKGTVPDALVNLLLIIVGFFFGSKVQSSIEAQARAMRNLASMESDDGSDV
jgi:hypothetical protein